MNDWSKLIRRFSKHSVTIDADWRPHALNRFDDGDGYDNWYLLYHRLYSTITEVIRWLMTITTINVDEQQMMKINDVCINYKFLLQLIMILLGVERYSTVDDVVTM